MNKTELVETLAVLNGESRAMTTALVDSFLQVISEALERGEDVSIPGFGSFYVADRAERTGRNPATGEAITIAASKTVKFKAGKTLKDKVNG